MKQAHKHAELIKAWADGDAIEFYDFATGRWIETKAPEWRLTVSYRIKPEPVVQKMYMHYGYLEEIIAGSVSAHKGVHVTLFESNTGMSNHLEFVVIDGKLAAVNIVKVK